MGADPRDALLALADEGLALQAAGEELIAEIAAEGDLGDLVRRGGPLVSRFEAMRRELPDCEDPLLRSAAEVLDMVFANHAMALHAALALLGVSWRSERLCEELHALDGLGRPALWLRTIRGELAGDVEPPALRPRVRRRAEERSLDAPVVISPKMISSAARPPSVIAMLSVSSARVVGNLSSWGIEIV